MASLFDKSIADGDGMTSLIHGAHDASPVSGLTHKFYRYPARFSPNFVRAAIELFTKPGDWVLDPYAGGGTTLVEAIAHGRNAIGVDISSLATFVSEAKTQILSDLEVAQLSRWATRVSSVINMNKQGHCFKAYEKAGYYRNIKGQQYWRLRKAIEQVLMSVSRLRGRAPQIVARCIVLKTAQWALDSRKTLPSVPEFRAELIRQAELMIAACVELRGRVQNTHWPAVPKSVCVNRSAIGIEKDKRITKHCAPKLVVTSPPYPGIHVLYHRWQVDGRKESPAPFWIANKLDGAGISFYTMGDRKARELRPYFENLEQIFKSVAAVCDENTTIVQMVAFSEAEWQLPKYLEVMERCGLYECMSEDLGMLGEDGRLWRTVPNRRWHAQQKEHSPGSREVVLIHRKKQA